MWTRRADRSAAVGGPDVCAYGRRSLDESRYDMASDIKRIAAIIAAEISARPEQAAAAIELL
ncbi:hypothetical protein EN749_32305, partial [Mesorhizobium sp. M7A.F.Ca.ET.027.02.1.1]